MASDIEQAKRFRGIERPIFFAVRVRQKSRDSLIGCSLD